MKFDEWKLNVSKAADEVIKSSKNFPLVVQTLGEVEPGTFTEDEAMAHIAVCALRMEREIDAI